MGFLLAANGLSMLYININVFKLYYGDERKGLFKLALGYKSIIIPIFAIIVNIFVSFSFAAMYGIVVTAFGISSTIATRLVIDAYGPISDNAGVFIGLIVGAMLSYWFFVMIIKIVGSATFQVVEEVCRQFNTIPRLMKDTIKLDYAIRVKISTNAFIIEMILPGALEFSLEDRAF
ncbi:hypothetical protein POTOM_002550 [Populus tomentosa]|uniref:H(+)-exporting diphosphatase n=1 Tax=Populus tomentosa TaxID=118781 RepID=A0A8X8DJY0_POPTO|nr:hypothetical protein POTOM_002550 [Populus tomentosa]